MRRDDFCVRDKAIKNRGRRGDITQEDRPVLRRAIGRDQGRRSLVPADEDLEQIFGGARRQLLHAEILEDEQVDLGERLYERRADRTARRRAGRARRRDGRRLPRRNRALARRLKEAKLRMPQACVEDLDYHPRRHLERTLIRQLATGRWVEEHHNVLITGATGVGKTYLACALGQQACRQGYRTIYRRLPRLFEELTLAHADGSYTALLARLARVDVLVLDDWGLAAISDGYRRDLLEVLDDRDGARSTVIASQLLRDDWHTYLGDPTIADAILDRLVHRAHVIKLKGRRSVRPSRPTDRPKNPAVDAASPMETTERFPQGFGKPLKCAVSHSANRPHRVSGRTEERQPLVFGGQRLLHCPASDRRFAPITMRGPSDHDAVD